MFSVLQDSAKFASSMIFERLVPHLSWFFLLTVLTVESVVLCTDIAPDSGFFLHAVQVARLVWQLQCLGEDGSLADDDRDMERPMWKHADAEISAINCFGMTGLCGQWCEAVVYGEFGHPNGESRASLQNLGIARQISLSSHLSHLSAFVPMAPMAPFCIVIERWSQTTVICKGFLSIFSVMSGTVPATSCMPIMPFGSLGNRYELEATPSFCFEQLTDLNPPVSCIPDQPNTYTEWEAKCNNCNTQRKEMVRSGKRW